MGQRNQHRIKEELTLRSVKTDYRSHISNVKIDMVTSMIFSRENRGFLLHYQTVGESGQVSNVTNWVAQWSPLRYKLYYL